MILSDVRLIKGIGPNAFARIREDFGPFPLIFVTGTPEEREPCDYAVAVLGKPVNEQALVRAFIAVIS